MKRLCPASASDTTTQPARAQAKLVWVPHVPCPAMAAIAQPHASMLCEAKGLASVALPPLSYAVADTLGYQAEMGMLSAAQMEGIAYAGQRHQSHLPSGERCGFILGDSAGVGKGRQIAGIMLDNMARGRPKHVWFSVSRDLLQDARRDFKDIGASRVRVVDEIPPSAKDDDASGGECVLFWTYARLISPGTKGSGKSRLCELEGWLGAGFEGVIVLDECHKAKGNVRKDDSEKHTPVGIAATVVALQDTFPSARIVYASATAIASSKGMGYMTRMGLWGKDASFDRFSRFRLAVNKVEAMEGIARDFKATGARVARSVSMHDVSVQHVVADLSIEDRDMYDALAKLWDETWQVMEHCASICNTPPNETQYTIGAPSVAWKHHFTAARLRHMQQMLACLKVKTAVRLASDAIKDGMCVIIGLQSTGEASATAAMAAAKARLIRNHRRGIGKRVGFDGCEISADTLLAEATSICRSTYVTFVEDHFPLIRRYNRTKVIEPEDTSSTYVWTRMDIACVLWRIAQRIVGMEYMCLQQRVSAFLGPATAHTDVGNQAYRKGGVLIHCLQCKQGLLRQAGRSPFPRNALDSLIDGLGGKDAVAELTGRKTRYLIGAADGVCTKDVREDNATLMEAQAFRMGRKLVAVLSAAASTGISLHADKTCPNRRKRLQITLELPWSAEQIIQQMGRSHRSNQLHPPSYVMLSTVLAGEMRFMAAIEAKLSEMGALCQGDSAASSGLVVGASSASSSSSSWKGGGGLGYGDLLSRHAVEAIRIIVDATEHPTEDGYRGSHSATEKAIKDYMDSECRARYPNEVYTLLMSRVIVSMGLRYDSPIPYTAAQYLNAVLGLPVDKQALAVDVLIAATRIVMHKDFTEGYSKIDLSSFLAASKIYRSDGEEVPEVVYRDPGTGGQVFMHTLTRDRGMTFLEAEREIRFEIANSGPPATSGFVSKRSVDLSLAADVATAYASSSTHFYVSSTYLQMEDGTTKRYVAIAAPMYSESHAQYTVIRPGIGSVSISGRDVAMFLREYEPINTPSMPHTAMSSFAERWDELYAESLHTCFHGETCQYQRCTMGKRVVSSEMVTGNLVSVWGMLEHIFSETEHACPIEGAPRMISMYDELTRQEGMVFDTFSRMSRYNEHAEEGSDEEEDDEDDDVSKSSEDDKLHRGMHKTQRRPNVSSVRVSKVVLESGEKLVGIILNADEAFKLRERLAKKRMDRKKEALMRTVRIRVDPDCVRDPLRLPIGRCEWKNVERESPALREFMMSDFCERDDDTRTLWGIAWDPNTGLVTHADDESVGIVVGDTICHPHAKASPEVIKRTLYRTPAKEGGEIEVYSDMKFMRAQTPEEIAEEKRFMKEGLFRDPAAPARMTTLRKLVPGFRGEDHPAPQAMMIEEEETEVQTPPSAAMKMKKKAQAKLALRRA